MDDEKGRRPARHKSGGTESYEMMRAEKLSKIVGGRNKVIRNLSVGLRFCGDPGDEAFV